MEEALKWLQVLVACGQSAMMGGVVFGWASLANGLLTEGGPHLAAQYVHAMFVLATLFSGVSPIVFGIVQEATGPRISSVVAHLLFILGCMLIALSNQQSPMYMPGVCLLAIAGPGAHAATMGVANLFHYFRGFITLLLSASFHLSFAVFYGLDWLWREHQYSYRDLFGCYAVAVGISMILSLLLWPDKPHEDHHRTWVHNARESIAYGPVPSTAASTPAQSPSQSQSPTSTTTLKSSVSASTSTSHGGDSEGGVSPAIAPGPGPGTVSAPKQRHAYQQVRDAPLDAQLQSRVFAQLFAFFVLSSLWANFYVGTVWLQLGDQFGRGVAADLSSQLSLAMAAGMLCVPVCAALMDHQAFCFPILAAIVALACLAWSLLELAGSAALVPASFCLYAAFRSVLFTYSYSFVADVFGDANFGLVVGLLHAGAGLVGLLQLPLALYAAGSCHAATTVLAASICTRGRWAEIHFAQALSALLLLYVAYYDWAVRHRGQQRQERVARQLSSFRKHESVLASTRYGALEMQTQLERRLSGVEDGLGGGVGVGVGVGAGAGVGARAAATAAAVAPGEARRVVGARAR